MNDVNRLLRRRSILAGTIAAIAAIGITGTAESARAGNTDVSQVVAVRSGDVTLVDADTRQRELTRGGSATEFAVAPPSGAECPGDSEDDSWRVQTFIVPAGVDPAAIPYGADWPRYSEHMYSLYDTITQPVIDVLTVPNAVSGGPGRIDLLPPMSFAVFPVGELPPGRYLIGIACTLFHVTADYWDTEIVIQADPDDSPGQMGWRLSGEPEPVSQPDDGGYFQWWMAAVAVVTLAAVGVVLLRRLNSSPYPSRPSKESQ